jgi:hypothetical protein
MKSAGEGIILAGKIKTGNKNPHLNPESEAIY